MSEWRPISSAPRDGTTILVAAKDPYDVLIVRWRPAFVGDAFPWYDSGCECWNDNILTHWMPTPDPPTNEAGE